ncbi:MAG: ABC transporter permease [Verrucomicrobia bacterium]|nr:ABC transporter permease [Verrucomicrobiota bacterium]MBV8277577.1 ABC transporter permease [Verrucomicrobiota bacterium]
MKEELQELYTYRELLYMMMYRDIKVRYKQSVIGFLWAILMPTLIVLAGVVVRFGFAVTSGKHLETAEIASVAVKSVPWAFLVSSIRFSCNSLTGNVGLVTKIYFPKEIFPLGAILANFFDLCVASVALAVLLFVLRIGWSLELLWIPLLLLVLVLLATGIGMLVSAASLFFRDVKYIVDVGLTFGIFFTPVFYDVGMFGDKGKWLLLNPAAPILEGFTTCITRHQGPDFYWLAYSFAFAIATVLGGYVFFKHLEPAFAESI